MVNTHLGMAKDQQSNLWTKRGELDKEEDSQRLTSSK